MAGGPKRLAQDEYLVGLWKLSFPVGVRGTSKGPRPTAPARLAELLDVSRPAAWEMIVKLEERGLVTRGARKEALLTPHGHAEAMRAVRSVRLVERFLVDTLHFGVGELAEHVAALAGSFTPEALERLYEALGRPERCPHGYPIDPDHELRENATLVSANSSASGTATLVRVSEHDAALASTLERAGVQPGMSLSVERGDDGTVILRGADGCDLQVDEPRARGMFFRRDGAPVIPATATCWADILRGTAVAG